MDVLLAVALGLLVGGLAGFFYARSRGGVLSEPDAALLTERIRLGVAEAQSAALRQNSEQFLSLAETRLRAEAARGEEQLRARGAEIEKGMETVGGAVTKLREYVETTDKARGEGIASLAAVAAEGRKTMDSLGAATSRLTEVLVSSQSRGQWGERMAEDVLRTAGFVEGIQYRKNTQLQDGTGRPDFTFLLPQGRVLHMDVKFPLAAYMRYLDAATDADRAVAAQAFLRDARARIQEITSRDYIDTAQGTLDYVLLFIPNEHVYEFIHETDHGLVDGALQQRVVLCSPFTLFAVLAVVRQAIDNFHLTQRTDEILSALGGFNVQWQKHKDAMRTFERRLDGTNRAFDEMVGTRARALDRQLEKVERLRLEAGLEVAAIDEPDADVVAIEAGSEDRQIGAER